MNQCFKIKHGTDFHEAVKLHLSLRKKWENVYPKVSELLGEKITELALVVDELWINTKELKNEDNKKLFDKNGKLKTNTKAAKELLQQYKQIIKDEGLEKFQQLSRINFAYGVMRYQGENLESYTDGVENIYYKADFDLAKRCKDRVESITEIQYAETYVELLKKKSA